MTSASFCELKFIQMVNVLLDTNYKHYPRTAGEATPVLWLAYVQP